MPNPTALRLCGLSTVCLSLFACLCAGAEEARRSLVWQTLHDYAIRKEPGKEGALIEGTQRFNSFVSYTNLGTDFGFHGPAENRLVWQSNEISGDLSQVPEAWAGMWHSLEGLAKERQRTLNFAKAFPEEIADADQPRITHLRVSASGQGRLVVEIKDANDAVSWRHENDLQSQTPVSFELAVPTSELTNAKFLNWTIEGGGWVTVHEIALGVEEPDWSPARRALITSYAKALRGYGPTAGFLRDRAHLEEGAFNTVSGSAMFALVTAAASSPEMSVVSREFASSVLRRLHRAATELIGKAGLLPHFVSEQSGTMQRHPGTELSSVDSAIYYHAMLLAARMLEETGIEAELLTQVRAIDFEALRLADGSISHGWLVEADRLIDHGWRDWGGETALVLLLNRIADPDCPLRPMDRPGTVWQGAGFIAELQSLFHPDFSNDRPDAIQGVRWAASRRDLLAQQKSYFPAHAADEWATTVGAYGLSAGENLFGNRYQVGGSALPGQTLIHPHYMLMSACLVTDDEELASALTRLRDHGFFPSWGLVECFSTDGKHSLPMNGGLNSTFEALGAYHWLAKVTRIRNVISEASRNQLNLRRAMTLFYPSSVAMKP